MNANPAAHARRGTMFLVNISVPVIYAGMAAKRGIMTKLIATCRIAACVWAIGLAIVVSSSASAGVDVWGCQGTVGDQQVTYNRYVLAVVPAKQKLRPLREIMDSVTIVEGGDDPASSYSGGGAGGEAFDKALEFSRQDKTDNKVTLTEKSSKKISSKSRLICGRDETTDIYRKIYRYQREGEPAQDITMQCIEFQMSTRGGRPCN